MEGRLFYCGISLLSACSWALGAILWRKLGERMSSYGMNLAKSAGAALCLGGVLSLVGLPPVSSRDAVLLALSGILGIAIGDTFFFLALMRLGPRRASLMGALNPVAIAVSAAAILGERPPPASWAGILATTFGVGWVLWERAPGGGVSEPGSPGIRDGLLSVLFTTGAVLLAKIGLVSVPALHAAWIRLVAATAALLLWGALRGKLGSWVEPLGSGIVLAKTAIVVAVVAFGGFWLSILALKHVDAAIAGTLGATSPLFILPMSAVLMKERITPRAVLGTVVAVGGVALILIG